MRNQAAKVIASMLLLAGMSTVALRAQLTVTSVGSVRHGTDTQVTVVFSSTVEEASGTNTANYTFPAGITVTGASLMTGLPPANSVDILQNPSPGGRVYDNMCVVLTVTGLAAGANTTLTVQNVKDRATPQNTIASTSLPFTDSGYTWAESGTPAIGGKVVAIGTNGFDIFSAGSGQWASYDEVVLVYKEVTGDFDYKARNEFQDFSSHWARAGVMMRENLNVGENNATQVGDLTATPPRVPTASRYVDVHANPVMDFNENGPSPLIHAANNGWESHYRDGGTLQGTVNGTDSSNTTGGPPPYPNAWLRIARTGDEIKTYHGSDGSNWDDAADRTADLWVDPADGTTPKPLNAKMYVGLGYGPETVNIPDTDTGGKNRLFLYQARFTALLVPYLRLVDANAAGALFYVDDAGSVSVNAGTVQLTVDGNVVSTSVSKSGTTTIIAYKAAAAYPPNSAHPFTLAFNNTQGTAQSFQRSFTTPNYATIPASYALAAPASTPGMAVNVYQIDFLRGPGDENSIVNAEQELAHGFTDASGTPYPNVASLSTANVDYVNWEQEAADINTTGTGTQPDHFNSVDPASGPIPNQAIPGIPGTGNDQGHTGAESGSVNNNIVAEVVTYLQLAAGPYRMGVNSDDGFKVSVAPGQGGPYGLDLGSFNGGRGASDTAFDFVVASAGYYPFRLLWWEGGGGANCEWYAVNLNDGSRVLINGPQTGAIKAFRTGAGRAYVQSILPANGFTGAQPSTTIKVTLVNGTTSVVNGSIAMTLDGAAVTPTINSGATTTVSYPGTFKFNSSHSGTLVWAESTTPQTLHTNAFSFTVRQYTPDDLPASSYWIEAEDFDATGTAVPAVVNTMPYDVGAGTGGAGPYDGIGATLNVDYFNNDNLDNTNPTTYRSVGDPNTAGRSVDLASDNGANFGLRRAGGFDMTTNYKIGWGDSSDWYNYTRNIPAGLYSAVIALSNGSVGAGTPDRMGGTLSIVTAGAHTTSQTLKNVGTFNGPSSGAWSYNNLVPLYAADGSIAAFKITAATTTLRFSLREGDYDWFALIPVSGVAPKVTVASPAANTDTPAASSVPRDAKIRLTLEDFSTAVVASSVKLWFDGVDVTSAATVNKNLDITTVTYSPALMAGGSIHNYELHFTDNGTPAVTQTNKVTFTVNAVVGTPGQFLIEAEDFNHDSGQGVAAANTMPYLGGAFTNLSATLGIDYNDSDGRDSQPYRGSLGNGLAGQNVNHDQQTDAGTLDVVRADAWTMTANFKLGWVGAGNWYNYTRTFPANTYEVWVALSHDPSGGLSGSLDLVTGDVTTTNQTATPLGTFDGPTSGGWGTDNLVQMKDSGGNVAVVSLSGTQTVRFNGNSGDYDYLLFVPGVAPLKFNAPSVTGTTLNLSWTGTGTLQEAANLTGQSSDWSNTTGVTGNSYSVSTSAAAKKFYRLKQ